MKGGSRAPLPCQEACHFELHHGFSGPLQGEPGNNSGWFRWRALPESRCQISHGPKLTGETSITASSPCKLHLPFGVPYGVFTGSSTFHSNYASTVQGASVDHDRSKQSPSGASPSKALADATSPPPPSNAYKVLRIATADC